MSTGRIKYRLIQSNLKIEARSIGLIPNQYDPIVAVHCETSSSFSHLSGESFWYGGISVQKNLQLTEVGLLIPAKSLFPDFLMGRRPFHCATLRLEDLRDYRPNRLSDPKSIPDLFPFDRNPLARCQRVSCFCPSFRSFLGSGRPDSNRRHS